MSKQNTITVIFRKESDGKILAVFPEMLRSYDPNYVVGYTLSEEHVPVEMTYAKTKTKPAKPEEYKNLLTHLSQIYKEGLTVSYFK